MEFGGVEGNLLHVGNATDDVGLARPGGLVLVQPVEEELLEKGGLAPRWQNLDLFISEADRGGGISMNWETRWGGRSSGGRVYYVATLPGYSGSSH